MKNQDFETFAELWINAHAISSSNQRPTASAVSMAFDVLSDLSIDVIREALMRHAKSSRFAPTPADIFDLVGDTTPQHLSADEAWAIVLESFDEFATVVMTQPMMDARLTAWPVWEDGDKIGARMAFKSAYERAVKIAPPPRWIVSEGYDKRLRDDAIQKAVNLGRLTHQDAVKYFPASMDGGAIGNLLTGNVVELPVKNKRIVGLLGDLGNVMRDEQGDDEEKLKREQERLEFEEKRRQSLDAVNKKLGKEVF